MKKGQIYEGFVEKYEFPNKGIINYKEEDKETKVVVKGSLKGQNVRFSLSKKRSGKCEGRLLEVLTDSPLEDRMPPCPNYEICGGCTYQKLSYENQLMVKGDMVKEIMDNAIHGDYVFEGILGSPYE